MIGYAHRALRDIRRLRDYYEDKGRLEAIDALGAALSEAEVRIGRDPDGGLAFPRPYPRLAKTGRLWLKAGRYWVAYSPAARPVILGVFFDSADIPRRI